MAKVLNAYQKGNERAMKRQLQLVMQPVWQLLA